MRFPFTIKWPFGKKHSLRKPPIANALTTPVVFHEPSLYIPPNPIDAQHLAPVSTSVDPRAPSIHDGGAQLNLKPPVSNAHTYPKLELTRPLFALLIGIDKYHDHPRLGGAVKDANDVADFLMKSMDVPPERIIKLLDHDATSDSIIEMIRFLTSNPDIRRGDAILIYFAGHGTRSIAPEGWKTADGNIEMICPVDISTKKGDTSGIPDFVLNALITKLADRKGNNITVILDCCHSASGLRGDEDVTIRAIDKPSPVPVRWAEDLQMEGLDPGHGAQLRSLDRSVLLAACGRFEEAGETPSGGLFTQRLLESIRGMSSDELGLLTYKDLIRSLAISDRQHPQCEGSQSHRYLFQNKVADERFISGRKGDEGNLVLDAGQALGISIGTEFDVYTKNSLSPDNPSFGRFTVTSVSKHLSVLSFADGVLETAVPNTVFATQACLPKDKKIKVYCQESKRLNDALRLYQGGFSSFATLVDARDKADLLVSFGDDIGEGNRGEFPRSNRQSICFDWAADNVISQLSISRIGKPIPLNDPEKVVQVFQAAARFHYYLYHGENNTKNHQVTMALYLLRSDTVKVNRIWIRRRTPDGEDLLKNNVAEIQLKRDKPVGPYGLKLSNYTSSDLVPQVFWFEGSNLAILPWYTSQRGAGEKDEIDAPLRARNSLESPGEFHLGYGEVQKAWGFSYNDEHKAVGFFKVFLATFNVNFEFLAQESPFGDIDPRAARRSKEETVDWWATQRATVVQLPP